MQENSDYDETFIITGSFLIEYDDDHSQSKKLRYSLEKDCLEEIFAITNTTSDEDVDKNKVIKLLIRVHYALVPLILHL